jgi:S-formylglutathione hydrolase FrmB
MALLQVEFTSETLLREVSFNVLLPVDGMPGLPPKPEKPYKTLYLLHGLVGNKTDWLINSQVQEMSQLFDLAIVMPSGDNSFYTDAASSAHRYSEFIGRELVDFTRKILPLSRKREDTLIGGLSMGGYGALYNGLRHHGTFGHVIALSSALITNGDGLASSSEEPDAMGLNRAYYETIFGDLTNLADSDKNLRTLAARAAAEAKSPLDLYVACGWNDMLLFDNRDFAKYLAELGIPLTYEEGPGTHEWAFWNTHLRRGLDRLYPLPAIPPYAHPFWIEKPAD